jgi:hypothetical protein
MEETVSGFHIGFETILLDPIGEVFVEGIKEMGGFRDIEGIPGEVGFGEVFEEGKFAFVVGVCGGRFKVVDLRDDCLELEVIEEGEEAIAIFVEDEFRGMEAVNALGAGDGSAVVFPLSCDINEGIEAEMDGGVEEGGGHGLRAGGVVYRNVGGAEAALCDEFFGDDAGILEGKIFGIVGFCGDCPGIVTVGVLPAKERGEILAIKGGYALGSTDEEDEIGVLLADGESDAVFYRGAGADGDDEGCGSAGLRLRGCGGRHNGSPMDRIA